MVKQLWAYFEGDLKFDQYCEKMERWINQEEQAQRKFVFGCYDTLHTERLTERSIFKLMFDLKFRDPQRVEKPLEILGLHQDEYDMFLDLFASDFLKIQ